MCAIFGIGLLCGHRVINEGMLMLIINQLFRSSQVRGRSASGLAITTEDKIHVLRRNISGGELVTKDYYADFLNTHIKTKTKDRPRLISIIGHCRMPTKGDASIYHNNHPIVTDDIVGVHNGSISNDEELWSTFQKQQEFERRGQVDSEIIFKLLNFYSNERKLKMSTAILNASRAMTGSFACATINALVPWTIWLFRKHNPTDVIFFKDLGMIIFASDKTYIKDAIDISGIKNIGSATAETVKYPICSGMSINLFTRKIYKFDLDNTHTTVTA